MNQTVGFYRLPPMEAFTTLLIIFAFLALGMAGMKLRLVPDTPHIETVLSAVLFSLLFFMGVRVGLIENIAAELFRLGLLSFGFAFATSFGTIGVIVLLMWGGRKFGKSSGPGSIGGDRTLKKGEFLSHLGEPLWLIFFAAAGFLSAFYFPDFYGWFRGWISSIVLYALLFLVGVQMVRNRIDIKGMLLHPATLILPLGTVAGSLIGGALVSPLFGLSPWKGLALASGFGWYSLSGVLITDMGDPILGSAGFMVNLLRELIALLAIPFLGRSRYYLTAIGVGGATSMDVTLPLVERSCGAEYVPLSISHGAFLSFLVPLLVPLFFQLG